VTCVQTTRLALVALFCSAVGGCAPPFYFAESTRGRVIDAQTKQPLPGAVIIGLWDMEEPFKASGRVLTAQETTADQNGNFTLPGWGPKLRPCLARLLDHDPGLIVFRSGYEPLRVFNEDRNNVWSVVRRSDWDGATFELVPFGGTPHDRFRQLDSLVGGLAFGACLDHGFTFPNLKTEVSREQNNPVAGRDWMELQNTLRLLAGADR
jgi:hypothetical protein